MQTTVKKGLTVKDLVTVGIFSALFLVFALVGGIFFAPNPVLTFYMPVGSALLCGPVYLLMPSTARGFWPGFWPGFWQLLVILSVMNLIDRFLVDDWWVGHTRAWTIPGTEDMKPYITGQDKKRKWLFGTVGMVVIAAVLAGVMALLVR